MALDPLYCGRLRDVVVSSRHGSLYTHSGLLVFSSPLPVGVFGRCLLGRAAGARRVLLRYFPVASLLPVLLRLSCHLLRWMLLHQRRSVSPSPTQSPEAPLWPWPPPPPSSSSVAPPPVPLVLQRIERVYCWCSWKLLILWLVLKLSSSFLNLPLEGK